MKTYIYVRDSDKAVISIGMVYKESGGFTDGMSLLIAEHQDIDAALIAQANVDIPDGHTARVVDTADLPGGDGGLNFDKLFHRIEGIGADEVPFDYCGWTDSNPGTQVDIEINGAKEIAHLYRRANREVRLMPLDKEQRFASTTPARQAAIVNEKQSVLAANAEVQAGIEGCNTETELRNTMSLGGLI